MTESPKHAAKSLLKPQYSLRWIFVEMTLTAVAVGCFAYFVNNPQIFRPDDVFLPFVGFFFAAGAALGGLAHQHVAGGFIGFALAGAMWPFLLRGLAS